MKQSTDDRMNEPLVSIITVVLNGKKHLEQAIKSVIRQTYDNIEYLVIDGQSTDGTQDIIRKYEGHIRCHEQGDKKIIGKIYRDFECR
jgi:glycosyltransferase involved in cell wall biosynthesis